jgi:hypothetical protein
MRLSPKDIGNRLFRARYVAGFGEDGQQEAFAKAAKVPPKSYSHWETGRVTIPLRFALNIMQFVPGLTLDYLYLGGFDYVSPALGRSLRDAPDRKPTKRGGFRKRRPPTLQ